MAENKTKATEVDVSAFIAGVEHPGKRDDAGVLDTLFREVTGVTPAMWGPTIIGYGSYHYRYESGHEGDMCRVGFSPRKAKHSLYLLNCGKDMDEAPFAALRERLGKYSRGKGCLYVNKLDDIDLDVLREMVALSWRYSNERHPGS
ncbi:DUF1801 domain-containing protein [Altererythrobacter salegens]|uniref:DUF1801 domain-containing protein n=1 Tax=Croceibacterium salegens TaxID=1737568 RepID=A0A6I4ST85_9SPHN|nr:DUF1801 domain-containing protein [Croceibacterium salegens]MXO59221.1 DUF1801 domain-containing protein [Croceibacterium salegens]